MNSNMSNEKVLNCKPAGYEDDYDDEFKFNSSGSSQESGRIRIVKGLGHQARLNKEDFDITLPPDVQNWLTAFSKTFNTFKKGAVVSQGIRMFFGTRPDLFEIVLKLYANLPGSTNPKSGTFAFTLIKELDAYLKCYDPNVIASMKKFISDDTKMVAFNFFHNQNQLFNVVCECYDLKSSREIFIGRIRELISEQKYKDACQSACDLELYEGFSIHDFLIPLILQDKMSVAEKYLGMAYKLQCELVTFLDSWLDHSQPFANFYDNYLGKRDINGVNYSKLHRKTLKKLVKRYAEMYKISKDLTPFLQEMDAYGMLQLLLNKKYVENSLKDWDEYIKETVPTHSNRLIEELINACCDYNDIPEAAKWVAYFNVDTSCNNYPIRLEEYLKKKSNTKLNEAKDNAKSDYDVVEVPPEVMQYSIDPEKICVINTMDNFYKMIGDLLNFNTLGFDCEWKFRESDIDLIQLSSKSRVYLIDVKVLKSILSDEDWRKLGRKIFRNEEILKLGFSQASDIAMIKKTLPGLCITYEKSTSYMDLQKLWRYLQEIPGFKLPFTDNSLGRAKQDLRQLTHLCLGQPLDKNQQFSNWAKRPLTAEQILYAASDAYCLLEIFDVLKTEAARLKVDLSDYELCKKLK
uniref:CSON012118 protein n=1 Tax=Culicoides sonorensis TaxID=179676 RepID=A0A336M779_CULSO